ncbi:YfbM family protein [Amycolatopsis sp. lyj-112]|uniref:YfbM family protein n=1 Tax=Amycolatopsis sp. lyj-112 TaxID=2789288 RepID=UPI00397DD088
MCGEYVRVTPEGLRELIEDPDRIWTAIEEATEVEDTSRGTDIDKAWHALSFLAARAGFEIDFVLGGTPLGEDNGYGPARYLSPDEVRTVSTELSRTGFDQLSQGVELAELAEQQIYPSIWDEPDALDYVRGNYDDLVVFFAGAAKAGDVVVTIIT